MPGWVDDPQSAGVSVCRLIRSLTCSKRNRTHRNAARFERGGTAESPRRIEAQSAPNATRSRRRQGSSKRCRTVSGRHPKTSARPSGATSGRAARWMSSGTAGRDISPATAISIALGSRGQPEDLVAEAGEHPLERVVAHRHGTHRDAVALVPRHGVLVERLALGCVEPSSPEELDGPEHLPHERCVCPPERLGI